MTTAVARYEALSAAFTQRVHGVPADRWDDPAPCPGWRARDVVGHLVGWLPPFLQEGAGIELRPVPVVTEDPVGAWQGLDDQVRALLDDPGTAEREFSNPHTGTMGVAAAILQFFANDVFLHTWDLAHATGQDEQLDEQIVSEMLAGMEPHEDLIRSSGQYGPRVPVATDADPQTRLLAFIGRPVGQPTSRR